MKKIFLIACHILFITYGVYALSGTSLDPSKTLYCARQLGMGGISIGFSNDANGVFSNPAALTELEFPQLTATSRKIMLEETQYHLFGWAVPTDWGTFGIGYSGMNIGGSPSTMRDPGTGRIIQNPSFEGTSYDNNVMVVSYSRKIPNPLKISAGGSLKLFNQSISGGASEHSAGNALDLNILIEPLPWLTLGASLQNLLSTPIKWSNSEDNIGGYYKLGAGINLLGSSIEALWQYPQPLRTGVDIDIPHGVLSANNSMLLHLGLEYFPLKNIALRAGINQEAPGSGLTLGVGLTNGGFRFDYAYVQRPGLPGDNPHYFSLSYVGERVVSYAYKTKRFESGITFSQPKDRTITAQENIAISAEAKAKKILDQKTTWTVTAISSTSEVREVVELVDLKPVYINGIKLEQVGTIETSSPLGLGRNVFRIEGFTSPEIFADKLTPEAVPISAEVKVLRIQPFADTSMDHWAIEPIALNVTLGLVKGYPDNTFKPEKGITRAELVTLLVRTLPVRIEEIPEESTFRDVPAKHWAAKHIAYGAKQKLVSGYPDGTFKPNKVLTRAEGITILARYAGLTEEAVTTPPFADLKPDFWANKYIAPAKSSGLIKYLEGKEFKHSEPFTRAEACEVLYRIPAIQNKVNEFWETGIVSAQPPALPVTPKETTTETKPTVPEIGVATSKIR